MSRTLCDFPDIDSLTLGLTISTKDHFADDLGRGSYLSNECRKSTFLSNSFSRTTERQHQMHSTVVIGSGPYGLSLAAHLASRKIEHRIFGHCMETWEKHMPPNMLLKSEGFASDLYAPGA